MFLKKSNGQPTALGRFNEAISTDPERVNERGVNRRKYVGHKLRNALIASGAVLVVAQLSEGGVAGAASKVDKAIERVFEGNESESQGAVASVGSFLVDNTIGRLKDVRITTSETSTGSGVTDIVLPTLPAAEQEARICATQPQPAKLQKYVSSTVYAENAEYLSSVGGNETALDPLWQNYFSADNNGMDPNNTGLATGELVVIRELTEDPAVTGCVIG
jgi:hypothetical protein